MVLLQQENVSLNRKLNSFKQKSILLREKFVVDIGGVLRESNKIECIKSKLLELEKCKDRSLSRIQELESSLASAAEQNNANCPTDNERTEATEEEWKQNLVIDLDDEILLSIFSFLELDDVMSVRGSCKRLFAKIDILFGMESTLTQSQEPSATANSTEAVALFGDSSVNSSVFSRSSQLNNFFKPVEQALSLSSLTSTINSSLPVIIGNSQDKLIYQINELAKKFTGLLPLIFILSLQLNYISFYFISYFLNLYTRLGS